MVESIKGAQDQDKSSSSKKFKRIGNKSNEYNLYELETKYSGLQVEDSHLEPHERHFTNNPFRQAS